LSRSGVIDNPKVDYQAADPDVRLMLQVCDGDAAAFEELVLRYQARLIRVLDNMVHNRHRAEELAQDVFLRVFRARSTYTPDARFATWLFTIAHNVAHNALRSSARCREVNVGSDKKAAMTTKPLDMMAVAPSGLMPVRQLDQVEMSEMVRGAIDSLNERQRMAVLLSRFEHMSYNDIARTMGLSVPAVKSLLSRARENLSEILKPYVQQGIRP